MCENQNTIKLLAKFHFENVPNKNLSKKLGIKFIEIFYRRVFQSKHSKVFYSIKDDKIICSAIIFTNYILFNKEISKFFFLPFLIGLITFKIPFSCLLDILKKKTAEKRAFKLVSKKCHLGLFFSNKTMRPESTILLVENLRKLHRYAAQKKNLHIWAVINNNNVKAEKFMKKLGYVNFYKDEQEIYSKKKLY